MLQLAASLLSTNVVAQETNAPTSKVSKIFERELPNVPGKNMRAGSPALLGTGQQPSGFRPLDDLVESIDGLVKFLSAFRGLRVGLHRNHQILIVEPDI